METSIKIIKSKYKVNARMGVETYLTEQKRLGPTLPHYHVWRIASKILENLRLEIKNNVFFSISILAALVTSFFNAPQWEYIDFKVIVCLFELMLVIKAFEDYGLLENIAVRIFNSCKNERRLAQALCMVSFLLSMFTTNDVAILTVIPILIVVSQKTGFPVIMPCILTTIAANLGSSITPIGNPQNLYMFSFFKMNITSFFADSLFLGLISMILLLGLSLLVKPKEINIVMDRSAVARKNKAIGFFLLSVLIIISVLGIIPYWMTFPIVILVTLLLDKNLLKKADYRLLLTFVFIFIAIGNISHIPVLETQLTRLASTPLRTYFSSIFLSQFMSNVPSTVMLSPFTSHIRALFYGVNIGGLGTPVASLASIIAFTLFNRRYPQKSKKFLSLFLLVNFCCLVVLGVAFTAIILFE